MGIDSRFLFWALAMVASLMTSGLCLRALAVNGISTSESLISRGFVCLLLVIGFSRWAGLTLRVKSIKTQCFRALIAGLALTFYTLSYSWLSASAVSVLSNMDVPLLLVIGPVIGGYAEKKVRLLALFSITFLVWFMSGMERSATTMIGVGTLVIGTILLCFGYLFIKRSMSEENEAVTILVPSLAILAYGVVQFGIAGAEVGMWSGSLVGLATLAGVGMFGAYYATMRLYCLTDIASAEFPTLLASIAIQPIEGFLFDEPLHVIYLLSSIGFVATTYLIMRMQMPPQVSIHE